MFKKTKQNKLKQKQRYSGWRVKNLAYKIWFASNDGHVIEYIRNIGTNFKTIKWYRVISAIFDLVFPTLIIDHVLLNRKLMKQTIIVHHLCFVFLFMKEAYLIVLNFVY